MEPGAGPRFTRSWRRCPVRLCLGDAGSAGEEWPELAIFLGDQIYADDSSPKARERIAEGRKDLDHDPETDLPSELVGGFEEYTWLYHESWSPEIERWFFSNVPTVMIFDDHEMIDDWNISDAWVRGIRQKDWWEDHVIGGLMTYWLYQHLGNLSPADIRAEGLLEALGQVADGEERLREWAMGAEEFTPTEGNYRFSFVRDIGRIRLVMIDSRNARVLEPRNRRMVNEDEWGWVVEACSVDVDHLLIGTSLPVFVPGGLHDLQEWSEAICDGAWGSPGRKFGEWLRVKADMEDWSAFSRSFGTFVQLLCDLGARSREEAPATISVLAGDIHFSFAAEIGFPDQHDVASRVHQLVSSPIRNALRPPESTAMRIGASWFAKIIGRGLRRAAGRRRSAVSWGIDLGPVFANSLGQIYFDRRAARLSILQAHPHEEAVKPGFDTVIDFDLVAGSRSHHDLPPSGSLETPASERERGRRCRTWRIRCRRQQRRAHPTTRWLAGAARRRGPWPCSRRRSLPPGPGRNRPSANPTPRPISPTAPSRSIQCRQVGDAPDMSSSSSTSSFTPLEIR